MLFFNKGRIGFFSIFDSFVDLIFLSDMVFSLHTGL